VLRNEDAQRRRTSLDQLIKDASKAWHGVKLLQPDWSDCSHSLAFGAEIRKERLRIHFIMNAYWEPLQFELPPLSNQEASWQRWIDTSLDSPEDIVDWRIAVRHSEGFYRVGARSIVVLFSSLQG
jgi:glycogen operon protein